MQTISVPYRCTKEAAELIGALRRIQSAAVRTAYANAMNKDGTLLTEKDLRLLVKARFAGGMADAWILHCATQEGREARKRIPDGKLVFGGRKHFERRKDDLIDNEAWKAKRLMPLSSRGDKTFGGNRHFKLSLDGRSCSFSMLVGRRPSHDAKGEPRIKKDGKAVQSLVWQTHTLDMSKMNGNQAEILRQAAALAAAKQINVMFRIDEKKLYVTIDPMDLPDHPERRKPVAAILGRAIGVDLNPEWIGVAAIDNRFKPEVLEGTRLLETLLVHQNLPADASDEKMRELLAAACSRIIGLARKHGAGTIVLEKGLGKLSSRGKNRTLNRKLNFWCRTVLVHMLTRKARLAGIKVILVWSGYSTTIGNLAFEAPDACASAAEIGRRGLAANAGSKEVLPAMALEVVSLRWKDVELHTEVREDLRRASTWGDLHRTIKAAKLGVRRPHPEIHGESRGFAVHRLGLKHRGGLLWQHARTPPSRTMTQSARLEAIPH